MKGTSQLHCIWLGDFSAVFDSQRHIPRYPHSVSHSYPYLTEEGAHFHLMMVVFPIVYPIPIGFPNLHMAQESIEGPQLLLQLFRVLLRNTLEEPPCQTPRQTIEKWEDDSWYDMGSSEKYICWLVISFVWYMIYYIYRYFIPTNGMTINKLTYSKCPIFCGAFYWSAFDQWLVSSWGLSGGVRLMWGGVESADGWSWKPHIFTSSTWSHLGQLEGQRAMDHFLGHFYWVWSLE